MKVRFNCGVSLNTDPPRSLERHRQYWQRSGIWEPDLWGYLTIVPELEANLEDRDLRIGQLVKELAFADLELSRLKKTPTDRA